MTEQFWTGSIVFIFGVLVFIGFIIVMLKTKSTWGEYSTRIIGLILVVVTAGGLLAYGLSGERVGPLLTLLGVIVGYLLGSWPTQRSERKAEPEKK